MASQDKTGTGKKNRAARKLALDRNGRIHINDGGTAIFELSVEGTAYAFRDIALDAWLAYSTGSVSGSSSAGLYTLTDKELKDVSTSTKKWYKTFEVGDYFVSGGKTALLTKQAINTSTKAAQFHLALDGYGPNLNCIGERIMVIPYLSIRRCNHQHWKEEKTATGLSKETGWLILCLHWIMLKPDG